MMWNRYFCIWFMVWSMLFFMLGLPAAQAEQKIYTVKTYPKSGFIGAETTINIVAHCAYDANLLPTSVNLIRVDESGKQLAVIGRMYDDGTHGDGAAGDNMFTGQVVVNETLPKYFYYKVSVAYKGTLQRLLSDMITIPVKTTVDAEQVRAEVIDSLAQGNVAAAKKQFSPGKNANMLDSLPPDELDLLRTWLENVVLTENMPNIRVYETHWIDDDGIDYLIKFMMIPNGLGEWKIVW